MGKYSLIFRDLGLYKTISRVNLVDSHSIRKINTQIIYYKITSILAERMCFSAAFGGFRSLGVFRSF